MTLEDAMQGAVQRIRHHGYGLTSMQTKEALGDVDSDGDGKLDDAEDLGSGQVPGDLTIDVRTDEGSHVATINEMAFFDVKPVVDEVYARLLDIVDAAEGAKQPSEEVPDPT